jgi:hypothetical protein
MSAQHGAASLAPGIIEPIWDANMPAVFTIWFSHIFAPHATAVAEEPAADAPAADRPATVPEPGVPAKTGFVTPPGAGSLAQPNSSARLTSAPTYNVATFFIAD